VEPASSSVQAGQAATYTVSVTPQFGSFGDQVVLSCSGLPALASWAFSPPSPTPGDQPAASTLSISTTASAALWIGHQHHELPPYTLWFVFSLLALSLLRRVARERLALRPWLAHALLLLLLALQFGCGGGGSRNTPPVPNPSTPVGAFTITITGASGSAVRTTTTTLVVQ
jgi:hypothetical protein